MSPSIVPKLRLVAALAVAAAALSGLWLAPSPARANTTYQSLPFVQDWTNTGLITVDDDWSSVPGIVGYRGDNLTSMTGADPQTILADGSGTPLQVFANRTNPNTLTNGGIAEFAITDPVVALQGSATARAPHLVLHLNTLGYEDIQVQYQIRDIDGSSDNALQQVAAHYRVGESGDFINLPNAYIPDATSGPDQATQVSTLNFFLPEAAENQPQVQLRIMTTDAAGSDEWIGIDNILVTGTPLGGDAPPTVTSNPADGAIGVDPDSDIVLTFSEPVDVGAGAATLECPAGTSIAFSGIPAGGLSDVTSVTLDPTTTLPAGTVCVLSLNPSLISDRDGDPNQLAGDTTISFTTLGPCDGAVVLISQIQGAGETATCSGRNVTVQAVVVGDFEGTDSNTLRGFYLQEEAADQDADPATSEGIFVFNTINGNSVSLGDLVEVSGLVSEYQGQTQITATSITVLGSATVAPTDVLLPFPAAVGGVDYLERFEGMLVRFPQTLYVTEHFQLGRFGQVVLSSGGRLVQPTHLEPVGPAADALQEANARNRIIVDDELQVQNPDPIHFGRGGNPLTASNTLRGGDSVSNLVGVLTYTWGGHSASPNAYRVRPVGALGGGAPEFVAANPRPTEPPTVGGGLRVAAFNLLNYFDSFSGCTLGVGGGSTDCRGANNPTEFARQEAKTIEAIIGLDADIIGLIELENDGYNAGSAIDDLIVALNAAIPGDADDYTFVVPDAEFGVQNSLGTDAIKVGLIYRPEVVEAIPGDIWTATGADAATFERRPLVQSFREISSGEVFSVAVNHFKSKGSCPDAGDPNADQGDGQSCWNLRRTQQAQALVDLLTNEVIPNAGDNGDPDVLIIGDLNSYAQEDPIAVLADAGYIDLAADRLGQSAYSYVFDGQWGYLDYALASPSLNQQVQGVAEWHINADEPSVLDYNTEFKSAGQQTSLYAADQFRSSDHDPVLVGIDLAAAPANQAPTLTTIDPIAGAQVGQPFTLSYAALAAAADEADPDGDTVLFRIESVVAGTLTKDGSPVTPGSTTLGPGESLVYTPASAGSAVAAFTVVAYDGELASSPAVTVRFAASHRLYLPLLLR